MPNDCPNPNSHPAALSELLAKNLDHLPMETITKLMCDNVARFYKIRVPEPVSV